MKSMYFVTALALVCAASVVKASGWECEEKEKGVHSVDLYNHVKGKTRTPAIFKLFHDDKMEVFRGPDDIQGDNVDKPFPSWKESTVYTIKTTGFKHDDFTQQQVVQQQKKAKVTSVKFFVNGDPEKEDLKYKQRRAGKLQMLDGKDVVATLEFSCEYYLKSARTKERQAQDK